jgi:ABC-type multidrug transport system ATPase subunit
MLHINDLTCRIQGRTIFDRTTAGIPAGHKVGLVGRNGAGKTTLLRLIAGELAPDGGGISVPRAARIGWVAQEAPGGPERLIDFVLAADRERARLLAEAETAQDPARIADIHQRLDDIGAYAAPAKAARILAGLGFGEAAQQRACVEFSGGWRTRVALAAVLFLEPELLLLDEPTSGLDPVVRRDFVRAVIGAYLDAEPERRTVLVSTHLISEFEGLIDEFTVVDRGRDRVTLETELARERFKRIRLRFSGAPPAVHEPEVRRTEGAGREVVLTTFDFSEELRARLLALEPEWMEVENLSLEEIFIAVAGGEQNRS